MAEDYAIEHRWVDLEGVANMRDLGGLPTTDGHRLRERTLLRSDNLQDLSESDVRHLLDELGVTDVVDLRSRAEEQAEGPGPLRAFESVGHHHHSLYPDDQEVSGGEALLLPWQREPEDSAQPADSGTDDDFWSQHYLRYLARRPDSVLAALQVIATAKGATLVHCAAGKDRTGTVIGLALSVAGVPDELVVADYAASAERIEGIIERLSATQTYGEHLAGQSVDAQTPKAETMVSLLAALRERFGGAQGWLRQSGWSDQDVQRLRDRLRE